MLMQNGIGFLSGIGFTLGGFGLRTNYHPGMGLFLVILAAIGMLTCQVLRIYSKKERKNA